MFIGILNFFKKKKKRKVVRAATEYTSVDLIKTPVDQLGLGMYVAELDIPWLESPFKFQGVNIETDKQLQELREVCSYVFIDITKQKKGKYAIKEHVPRSDNLVIKEPPPRLGSFEDEILRASMSYQEAGILVTGFMDKIANGGGVDSYQAKEAVRACVDSILHSPDAIIWLSQLKDRDQYTAQHSLNVCVLSIVLARHIGMNENQLNHVGLCGMMHDMGKMLVPSEILNKPGRLEPDELQIMQSHTTLGYELLKASDDMFPGAIETAWTHHERLDGKGYPRQIKEFQLSLYSNIVAIADMYDAITSDRVYQRGRTHLEATKIMLENAGNHLKSQLVVKFIESLGSYPPGSFVELSNGCIAIVVEQNLRFKLRPKVLLVLNEEKFPAEEEVIDLATKSPDIDKDALSIRGIIKPEDYGIDGRKYYHDGVLQKGFLAAK